MSSKYELIDAEGVDAIEDGENKYTIVQICEWRDVSVSGADSSPGAIPGAARRSFTAQVLGRKMAIQYHVFFPHGRVGAISRLSSIRQCRSMFQFTIDNY